VRPTCYFCQKITCGQKPELRAPRFHFPDFFQVKERFLFPPILCERQVPQGHLYFLFAEFMSTPPPHSLSLSPSVQQSINTNIKRNSLGSNQLPLPSGLNAPVAQRGPVGSPITTTSNAGPSSPRGFGAGAGRPSETFQSPNSPILANFSIPQPTPHIHTSSTHAGGIQPAAAFFRPSRPTYQPQYSRPGSPSSLNVPQEDHFQLAPINSHYDSDEHHIAESIAGGNESEQEQHFISLKRMKQSREPLLPGPNTTQPKPSMSASNSTPATRPCQKQPRSCFQHQSRNQL
jgi:palmitoyltransferase ZDHHC9/14/18